MNDEFQKISINQIKNIIGFPTLDDLSTSPSEIDNDIQILLDWIQPILPERIMNNNKNHNVTVTTIPQHRYRVLRSRKHLNYEESIEPKFLLPTYSEPSNRIKLAIKSCFKNELDQFKFIDLYLNSFSKKLNEIPSSIISNLLFAEYMDMIKLILHHYDYHIDHFNFTNRVKTVFNNKFYSIVTSFLFDRTDFIIQLTKFLENSLFYKRTFSDPHSSNMTLNIIDVISTLVMINLSDKLNEIIVQLSIFKIKNYTLQSCSGIWDKPLLNLIDSFIQNEIYPNFSIFVSYTTSSNLTDSMNNVYLYELMKIAHNELITQRIKEIYSLVLVYPTSEYALKELHICLSKNKMEYQQENQIDISTTSILSMVDEISSNTQAANRLKLVENFIFKCKENLLHAGANTVDVITAYTKTIKSFLLIDPKGVLLDKVVRPIRDYLKSRDDIIVKLVHGLLDTSETNKLKELPKELSNPHKQPNSANYIKDVMEDSMDLNWSPDPIDALPDFKKDKINDIIESLLSIFESKDIFIEEFTKLFGDQLIKSDNFNVGEIESKLNLLKLRFGKNNFHILDIMLKDFHTSAIMAKDHNIVNDKIVKSEIVVLSQLYWTTILDGISSDSEYKLPKEIDLMFKKYQKNFKRQKQGRTLKLIPSLGKVTLGLNLRNKKEKLYQVNPHEASIISLFNETDKELSVDFISKTLNMPNYLVTEGLAYWEKEGILSALTKTLYIVNEDEKTDDEQVDEDDDEDDEDYNKLDEKESKEESSEESDEVYDDGDDEEVEDSGL
ncbi:hypothetical protein KGF54_003776 [Candida jiufengensis]|uniref:uncharacterized protein n=1 Tax=Candida jiufengensis TaxID=497108 RepID=UPI0022258BBD|nr:uncharacterized protein KGF54_003776 [Candida jiufengensis]KAI5952909.1 hypothetical protein KGF54_003776 [Candida jiufengensis]